LAIEVDGGIHLNADVSVRDFNRTFELEQLGIKVRIISNFEIETDVENVLKKIELWLNGG